MPTSAQPHTTAAKCDPEALQLLMDNVHNLEHPLGWIKHPYFQERLSGNPEGVREIKKRFCEAIVLLLEKNDKLKKRPGRPRKSGDGA